MLMIRTPVQALNKALFDTLAAALGSGCPVFDGVPQNKQPPFAAIVETDCTPWNTKTTRGAQVTATIRFYSTYKGDKQISGFVNAALTAVSVMARTLGDDWQIVSISADHHKVERTADDYREAEVALYFKIYDAKE